MIAGRGGQADRAVGHRRAGDYLAEERGIDRVPRLANCAVMAEVALQAEGDDGGAVEAGLADHFQELAYGAGRSAGDLGAVETFFRW